MIDFLSVVRRTSIKLHFLCTVTLFDVHLRRQLQHISTFSVTDTTITVLVHWRTPSTHQFWQWVLYGPVLHGVLCYSLLTALNPIIKLFFTSPLNKRFSSISCIIAFYLMIPESSPKNPTFKKGKHSIVFSENFQLDFLEFDSK